MLIKQSKKVASSAITPESVYLSRRQMLRGLAALAGTSALPASALVTPGSTDLPLYPGPQWLAPRLASSETTYTVDEKLTPYSSVITYNNFYEFGLSKEDPFENAQGFNTDPWKVEITGEVDRPGVYTLEDILARVDIEERIYRFRCVEAWSMVIPWLGFSLASLIKQFNPTSKAKYVEFVTLEDPDQMPGQRGLFSTIEWPYREGLRMDEALNPLTILAVGVYGQSMPPQNGAPLRLVVPWKYGFKSIKSIVSINFRETMPENTWRQTAASEYGFFANVNPKVDHPRWSQATERRLPSSLFNPNIIETQMFNGYADEVAGMYSGMDLSRWY